MNHQEIGSDLSAQLERQIAAGQLELPVLPTVATEVLSLCQQESTDAARLSSVIHNDPTMAANILRVANSAAFVGNVPCSSLQQAVSRLGMQRIGDIAVAVAVKGNLFSNANCTELLGHMWRHSVVVGYFTKEIARVRRRNVEIAFLCGLLHDIGKPVLLANIDAMQATDSVSTDELGEILQQHHTASGRALAVQWQLPDQIAESIEFHHRHDEAPHFQEMAATVCLADLIAHGITRGDAEETLGAESVRRHPVIRSLNLYPDQLEKILAGRDKALEMAEGMA